MPFPALSWVREKPVSSTKDLLYLATVVSNRPPLCLTHLQAQNMSLNVRITPLVANLATFRAQSINLSWQIWALVIVFLCHRRKLMGQGPY